MSNIDLQSNTAGFSMRRTFLTLFFGMAAFGVLTMSYATADLPDATVQTGSVEQVLR